MLAYVITFTDHQLLRGRLRQSLPLLRQCKPPLLYKHTCELYTDIEISLNSATRNARETSMLRALQPTMGARLLVSTSTMVTPQLSRTFAPTLIILASSTTAALVAASLARLDIAPDKPYHGSAKRWTRYIFTVKYTLSPILSHP